jgi:hypothetical protein
MIRRNFQVYSSPVALRKINEEKNSRWQLENEWQHHPD